MKTVYVMGLDGGGSKTECAVRRLDTGETKMVRGEGSNHEGIGYDKAARIVTDLVRQGLAAWKIAPSDIAGACFAMAGMDIEPDRDNIRRRIVEPLGLSCPVLICNDAFAGFRAGSPRGVGLCVSLGSGTTFCGRNSAGESLQFEYPNPGGIDLRIINALLAERHGIGPHCGFRDAYLAAIGLSTLEEFFQSRYTRTRGFGPVVPPEKMREARRAVFSPEVYSDPLTCRILEQYARELAEILVGMGRKLKLQRDSFDLVLSGSLLMKGRHPAMNDTLARLVRLEFPGAEPVLVDGLPVDGAVRLATELAARS